MRELIILLCAIFIVLIMIVPGFALPSTRRKRRYIAMIHKTIEQEREIYGKAITECNCGEHRTVKGWPTPPNRVLPPPGNAGVSRAADNHSLYAPLQYDPAILATNEVRKQVLDLREKAKENQKRIAELKNKSECKSCAAPATVDEWPDDIQYDPALGVFVMSREDYKKYYAESHMLREQKRRESTGNGWAL